MERGQLWQECEHRGCRTQPVCVECFECETHCCCTADDELSNTLIAPAQNTIPATASPGPRFAPDLITFECGGMAGARFPDPTWPTLPGAQFRASGAASQIYGTREECLEWARLLWKHAIETGIASKTAWFHLVTLEMGYDHVQGYIHSQFVREVVGIEALVDFARGHAPLIPPSRPHTIDMVQEARLRVAARWEFPIHQLTPVDDREFTAALEAARGRRAYNAANYRCGTADLVDDYWVRNGAGGRGIDQYEHIWSTTYAREWIDLTALAEEPVSIPIAETVDQQTMAAICGYLRISHPIYNRLYRYPDGSRRLWSNDQWHIVPELTEDELSSGLRIYEEEKDRRAEKADENERARWLQRLRTVAERSQIRNASRIAFLNTREELRRSKGRNSDTVLMRFVAQNSDASEFWELWGVHWEWASLGEDGETGEEFSVFADRDAAATTFAAYSTR